MNDSLTRLRLRAAFVACAALLITGLTGCAGEPSAVEQAEAEVAKTGRAEPNDLEHPPTGIASHPAEQPAPPAPSPPTGGSSGRSISTIRGVEGRAGGAVNCFCPSGVLGAFHPPKWRSS